MAFDLSAALRPDLNGDLNLWSISRHHRCHRVAAHPDEELELLLRHFIAGRNATFAELGEAGAEPTPGRVPGLCIVASQRRRQAPVSAARGHRAQEVFVAATGTHHAHRNRYARKVRLKLGSYSLLACTYSGGPEKPMLSALPASMRGVKAVLDASGVRRPQGGSLKREGRARYRY